MTSIVSSRRLGADDRRISSNEQEQTKMGQKKKQSSFTKISSSSNHCADETQQEESLDDRISNVQQRILDMFEDDDSFDENEFQVMVPKSNRGEFAPATSRFLKQQQHHKSFNDTSHLYTDDDILTQPAGRPCAPKSRKAVGGLGALEQIMVKVEEHEDKEMGDNDHHLVLDKLMSSSFVSSSKTPAARQTSISANIEDIIRQKRNGNSSNNESSASSLKTSGSPDALNNRSGHSLGDDGDAFHRSASPAKSTPLLATDRRPNSSRSTNTMLVKAGLSPKQSKTPMGLSPLRSRPGPTGHSPPRSMLGLKGHSPIRTRPTPMGHSPPQSRPSKGTHTTSGPVLSPAVARRMVRLQQGQNSPDEKRIGTGMVEHISNLPASASTLMAEEIGSSGNLSAVSIPRSGSSGQLSSSSGHKTTSGGRGALRRRRKTQPEECAPTQSDIRSRRHSSLSLSSHGASRHVKAPTLSMNNDEERISAPDGFTGLHSAPPPPPPPSSHRRTPPPPSNIRSGHHARRAVSRHSSAELTEEDDAAPTAHRTRTPSCSSRRARRQPSMENVEHDSPTRIPSLGGKTEHPGMTPSGSQQMHRPTKSVEHGYPGDPVASSSRRAHRRSSIGPKTPESTTPSSTQGVSCHSSFEHNKDTPPASSHMDLLTKSPSDRSLQEIAPLSSRRASRRSSIGPITPESTTPSNSQGDNRHSLFDQKDDTPPARSRQMNRLTNSSSDQTCPGESATSNSRRATRRSSIGPITPESTPPSNTQGDSRRHLDPFTKSSSDHSVPGESATSRSRRAIGRSSTGRTAPESTPPSNTPGFSRHSSFENYDDPPHSSSRHLDPIARSSSDHSFPGESATSSSRRANRRSSMGRVEPESTIPSSTPAVTRHSSLENNDDPRLPSSRHLDPFVKSSSDHSFPGESATSSSRRANRRSSMGHISPESTTPSNTPAVSRHSALQHNDDTPAPSDRTDSGVFGTWDIPLAQSGRRRGSQNDQMSTSAHSAGNQCSRSTNSGRRPTRRTDALSSSLHGATPQRSRSSNPGRRSSTRAFDSISSSTHHQRSRSTNASRRTTTRGGTRRSRDIPLDASHHDENLSKSCATQASTNHDTGFMDPPANATTTPSSGVPGKRRSVDPSEEARPQSMAAPDSAVVSTDQQRLMSSSSLSNDLRDDEPVVKHQSFSDDEYIGEEESEDEGVVLSRNLRQIAAIEHKPASVRRLRPRVDSSSGHRSKSCDRRRSQRPRPPAPVKEPF